MATYREAKNGCNDWNGLRILSIYNSHHPCTVIINKIWMLEWFYVWDVVENERMYSLKFDSYFMFFYSEEE